MVGSLLAILCFTVRANGIPIPFRDWKKFKQNRNSVVPKKGIIVVRLILEYDHLYWRVFANPPQQEKYCS